MGLEATYIDDDAIILETRIPQDRGSVEGLEYGGFVNQGAHGWCGYYVRPEGAERWGVARCTPASDELYDHDAEIVRAIRAELDT
jgi:hypothetical protein